MSMIGVKKFRKSMFAEITIAKKLKNKNKKSKKKTREVKEPEK